MPDKAATGTIPLPLYWVLIVESVNGVGVVMTLCSLFEFVMAQTPNRMRGIMMGLVLTMYGASELGVVLFTKPFHQLQATTPSCVFYYYLVLSLFIQLMLYSHICYSCQALQAEKERETHKHPCNS